MFFNGLELNKNDEKGGGKLRLIGKITSSTPPPPPPFWISPVRLWLLCQPDGREEVEERNYKHDVADIRGSLQEVLQVGVP